MDRFTAKTFANQEFNTGVYTGASQGHPLTLRLLKYSTKALS